MATCPTSTSRSTPRSATSSRILRDERTEPKKFREVVRELSWLLGYEALADARIAAARDRKPHEHDGRRRSSPTASG